MKQEVEKQRPFGRPDGNIRDLSFLNTYQAIYVQYHESKEPLEYRFWVVYSPHCFTENYEHQTNEEEQSLMYHAPKKSRPFCQRRYNLVRTHLRRTVLALSENNIVHVGYGGYVVIKVDLDRGDKVFCFVTFRAFREKKKLRLHVTSAYPISEKQGGKSVKFFTIAYSSSRNRQLPQPSK